MTTQEILEHINTIKKCLDWVEMSKQPEDFIKARLAIKRLTDELKHDDADHSNVGRDWETVWDRLVWDT